MHPPFLAISQATLATNNHEIFNSVQTKWHEILGGNLYDAYGNMRTRIKLRKWTKKLCIFCHKKLKHFCKPRGILGRSGGMTPRKL